MTISWWAHILFVWFLYSFPRNIVAFQTLVSSKCRPIGVRPTFANTRRDYWSNSKHVKPQSQYFAKQHNALAVMHSSLDFDNATAAPVVVAVALLLGIAAQGFINQMLQGDQGLGAFLKDGSGYQKSGFRPLSSSDTSQDSNNDPLPWLKLPKLSFVEVAGQEENLFDQLDSIKQDMAQALMEGRMEEANSLREDMERLMKKNGIEYIAEQEGNRN